MVEESTGIHLIRPCTLSDLDTLQECAELAKYGLYSLPKDRQLLKKKIHDSESSFAKNVKSPEGEVYLFVLEDVSTGKVIGTTGIVAKVGHSLPFYGFKLESKMQKSISINVEKEHKILTLNAVRRGPTEIGSLFLNPLYRKGGLGKLLSLCRFLFMAQHAHRFHETIVAEMRGVVRDDGYSPFWQHLGRHFFQMDFPTACLLRSIDEQFIGDLAPQFPIYVEFLPLEAQEVIGRTHEYTLPALHMLQKEGFSYQHDIDVFDAGPDIYANLKDIRTVVQSTTCQIQSITSQSIESPQYLIGTSNIQFRACISCLKISENGTLIIPKATADALEVQEGDTVRYIPQ